MVLLDFQKIRVGLQHGLSKVETETGLECVASPTSGDEVEFRQVVVPDLTR